MKTFINLAATDIFNFKLGTKNPLKRTNLFLTSYVSRAPLLGFSQICANQLIRIRIFLYILNNSWSWTQIL